MRRRDETESAAATISNPVMMPPLYPNLLASQPAASDIRK